MAKHLSESDRLLIKELLEEGLCYREIAEIVGCSKATVQHWARKFKGTHTAPAWSQVTAEEAAKMCAMREDGKNWSEIGRAFGRHPNVVRRHVDKAYKERQVAAVSKWNASEHGKEHTRAYNQTPERKRRMRASQEKLKSSPKSLARYRRNGLKRTYGPKAAENRAWRRAYHAKRRENPEHKAMQNLRSSFCASAKRFKTTKRASTPETFGITWARFCRTQDPELVRLWLEEENAVHMDHIRPISSFPDKMDPEQMALCWSWRNFELLTKSENTSKGDKFTREDAEAWAAHVRANGYRGPLFLEGVQFTDDAPLAA